MNSTTTRSTRSVLCFLKDSSVLTYLANLPPAWEITFTNSRQEAFDALSKDFFAAVATDHYGDDADSAFLGDVAKQFPKVARILFFNPAEKLANAAGRELADQCVPKPCQADIFVDVVIRSVYLHRWLSDPALRQLIGRMQKLPSVPSIYFRLVELLQSPNSHLGEVAHVMSQDLVMTAKLLQLVNSPFFGLRRAIHSLEEAVTHLGLAQTKTLVLLTQLFSSYVEDKSSAFSLEELWRHSTSVARFARRIVNQEMDDPEYAETVFTAGLLHDVGKLFYAVNCASEFNSLLAQADLNDMSYVDAERNLLGTTHAELGACVLGTWGIPAEILKGVAFHHKPSQDAGRSFNALTAIHVANAFEYEVSGGNGACRIDYEYLSRIGCQDRLADWRKLCLNSARPVRNAA